MWIRPLLIGTFSFAFVPALAIAGAAEPAQFRNISVQAGQGGAIAISVPIRGDVDAAQPPYALTGSGAVEQYYHLVPMRLGQGGILLVKVSD